MLRILFLEDLVSDFELAKTELQRNGFSFECVRVENKESFLTEVECFRPDIIISDYMMPSFTGMEALKLSLEFKPKIPFIILTGSMNEDTAVKCLKSGADDYVIKEHIARLPYSVKEILEQKELNALKAAAEENLLQSEENFRRSLDESQLGIIIESIQGENVYVNKALLDIYEYASLDEFISIPAKNSYTPESYAEHKVRKALRKQGLSSFGISQYELSIIRKNGEVRNLKVFRSQILWNRTKHYQVISQDITEQKKAEDAIRKLSRAVEQSPIAIFITNTDGIIEYVNPKTTELSGYSVDELIGKNPRIFSSGEKSKESYMHLWKTITAGNTWSGEFHNRKKNGELFWELASISPILNEKGQITNYLAVKEDITERKQLIEDLIIAKEHAEQSDKLKSAFLANMSHEIRTPMNGILGFSELLQEPELSGEKQQKYIKIIQKSGARMLNIINDIVDISKIEAGLMKVDINELNIAEPIEYIYTFFKPEIELKGLQFFVENNTNEKEIIIKSDREKIYAILTNLIKNAIKYTNKGLIVLSYDKKGDFLEFSVKDTGIGIPKDRQEAIFERFIQADIYDKMARQGAGLGLSITKSFVEMLGGKIWVKSAGENLAEGKEDGAIFYFTIPCNTSLVKKKDGPKLKYTKTIDNKGGRLKILIAEDDEASQMLLSNMVEEYASEIFIANDGIEAVEIYKHHPDIDLILMDIQMPKLNGYAATGQIRHLSKKIIIIAQTAFALTNDKQKVIDAGCNDYISKPISKTELQVLIQKYFR